MTFRFPIRVGQRVALAPHLDLWMAGVRYGTCVSIDTALNGQTVYTVQYGRRDQTVGLLAEDLLGGMAVSA